GPLRHLLPERLHVRLRSHSRADRQPEEGPESRCSGDQFQRRAADAAAAARREFAKAYDGPPTDPKVFEENQKKLQEELQKRAEEQRKKLEGAGGAPANPAAK